MDHQWLAGLDDSEPDDGERQVTQQSSRSLPRRDRDARSAIVVSRGLSRASNFVGTRGAMDAAIHRRSQNRAPARQARCLQFDENPPPILEGARSARLITMWPTKRRESPLLRPGGSAERASRRGLRGARVAKEKELSCAIR